MLEKWLDAQTRSRGAIAREIGISDVHLWRIATGRKLPSPQTAIAIERVTGIPALSWADEALRRARTLDEQRAA